MEEQVLNPKDPYQWSEFEELFEFVSNTSFGHLTYVDPTEKSLDSLALPFLIEKDTHGTIKLVGHCRADRLSLLTNNGSELLVIFQGPHGSISAGWHESAMQYPTWNYVLVKVFGVFTKSNRNPIQFLHDLASKFDPDFLPQFGGERMNHIHALVPELQVFEIIVTRFEGVKKLSQNKSVLDRAKMAEKLDEKGNSALADWIRNEGV